MQKRAEPGFWDSFGAALSNVRQIVSQKRYMRIFLLSGTLSFVILSFLTLATTTGYSIDIFVMMNGFWYTFLAFLLTFITSILIGAYASLIACRLSAFRQSERNARATGALGMIAGILGSGCPMCGSFIFGLFGAPLALMALPFQGLEIKALGIAILFASVSLMSKSALSCKRRFRI